LGRDMPNFCENTVVITGDTKQIQDLCKRAENKKEGDNKELLFSFEKFIPTPPEFLRGDEWYDGWCEWRITNWGTKRDTIFSKREWQGQELIYNFDTAWSPPLTFLESLSGMYPRLSIRIMYQEGDNCIYGEATFENGVCVNEKSYSEEEYREAYDEDYKEKKAKILELSPDELVNSYSHLLEPIALKRIPDRSLPLLITYEWFSDDAQNKFEERMKGTKETKHAE